MTVLRLVVLGGFLCSAAVALTYWGVRTRRLEPFGTLPRLMRRLSDPVLRPLERRMVKSGHNPQEAPTWLFWLSLLGGLAVLGLAQWAIAEATAVAWAVQSGPRGTLVLVIESAFSILQIAILVRVVSSWFGISPYAKWMRPVMWLTNWLVEPIRRMLPPFGMLDFSPLVALLVLWLARTLLLSVL